MKSADDCRYERVNMKGVKTTETWDGKSLKCPSGWNFEVRDPENDEFRPNIANLAPRPKNWKVGENEHDF